VSKNLTCRQVRDWLQDRHDREDLAPPGAEQPSAEPAAAEPLAAGQASGGARAGESRLAREVDVRVEAHLEGCADCRRFRDFLWGFGRELAGCLDAVAGRLPQADPADYIASASARPAARAWRPPARARRRAARWAVPAAAAALLAIAAGILAPRLAPGARVRRSIRADTAALVEELFSQPLAQGVEVGLVGASELEGLSQGDGLQGLGEGEGEPLSP
jgi:hypothetical protein